MSCVVKKHDDKVKNRLATASNKCVTPEGRKIYKYRQEGSE